MHYVVCTLRATPSNFLLRLTATSTPSRLPALQVAAAAGTRTNPHFLLFLIHITVLHTTATQASPALAATEQTTAVFLPPLLKIASRSPHSATPNKSIGRPSHTALAAPWSSLTKTIGPWCNKQSKKTISALDSQRGACSFHSTAVSPLLCRMQDYSPLKRSSAEPVLAPSSPPASTAACQWTE